MGPLTYHHQQELTDINLNYPMETEAMIKLPIGYKKKKDYYYQIMKEEKENDHDQEYNYFQKLVSPFIKLEELIHQFQDLPSFIFHQDFDYFITCWMEYQYYIILSKEPIWRPKVMDWLDNAIKYLESMIDHYHHHHQPSTAAVTTNTNNNGDEELKWKECPQSSTFHMYWAFKRLLNRIKIMSKLITMIENGRWLNQTPQMVVIPIYKDILQQRLQPFLSSSTRPYPHPSSPSSSSPPPSLSYYPSTLSSSFSTPLQTPFISEHHHVNPITNMNPFENQFHHVVKSSSSSSSSTATTTTPPSSSRLSSSPSSFVPSPILPYHSIPSSSFNKLPNTPTVSSSSPSSKPSYSCLEVMPYLNDSYSNNISYVHPTSVMLPPSTSLSLKYPNENNNNNDINYYDDQSAMKTTTTTTNNCFYHLSTCHHRHHQQQQQQQYYQCHHPLPIDTMNYNSNSNYYQHNSTNLPSPFYPKESIHEVVVEEDEVEIENKQYHNHPSPLVVSSYPYHHHHHQQQKVLKNIANQLNNYDHYEEVEVEEEIVDDIEVDSDDPMKDKDYQDNESIMTNDENGLSDDDDDDDDDDPLLSNHSKKKSPTKKGYARNKKNHHKKKIDNNNTKTTIFTNTTTTKTITTNNNNNYNIQLKKININSQQQRRQRRRGRTATSYDTETTKYLKRVFFTVYSQRDKLTKEQRKEVQRQTQLQPRNITYWFSNHKRRFQESLELYKRVIAESNGSISNYDDYLNWRREQGLPEED